MYATIRRYEGVTERVEELAGAMRKVASSLSRTPGFVCFVMVEAETDVLATVGIFDDQDSLDEADRLIGISVAQHLAELLSERAQATTGEIILQRGF